MKAIRTKDTHEWVRLSIIEKSWVVSEMPELCLRENNYSIVNASLQTGHPCEWIDVEVTVETDHPDHTSGMMTSQEYYFKVWWEISANKHLASMEFATDYANYVSEIQAVRFTEWLHNNYYKSSLGWHRNCDPATKETAITTEQLLKKWKEEQNEHTR